MLLRHTARLEAEALAIEDGVRSVLDDGARTRDLARGSEVALSTQEMGARIHDALVDTLRARVTARFATTPAGVERS